MGDETGTDTAELQERVRRVLDTNNYLVLGTSEDDGTPRVSPVFFNHEDYRTFYWVSSPNARHSHNLADRPAVTFVVFDSRAVPGQGVAVYVVADAEEVPVDELEDVCARAFTRLEGTARVFAPEELQGSARLRLYRARATSHDLHIPGGDPKYGTGSDQRRAVPMP